MSDKLGNILGTDSPATEQTRPGGPVKRRRGRPIDILSAFGSLRTGKNISVQWRKLCIETSPRPYELHLAAAVAQQIKENIQAGRNPSGRKSKALSAQRIEQKGAKPRGIDTGQTLDSIRLVEHPTYVSVTITERGPGAFRVAMGGARWTYNPKDHLIKSALMEIYDIVVGEGTGELGKSNGW